MAFVPKDKGKPADASFSVKEIDKSVAKITDSLYAGKYEVTNLLYRYWGFDLIKDNKTDMIKIYLPDSLNWRDKLAYNEPFVTYYFRHPAYDNYPVVNVTYEAAVKYCAWLTDKYNADSKRHFKKVLFRLPTQKEWENAATGATEDLLLYPWGNRLFQNGKFMCNFRQYGDESIKIDTITKKLVVDYAFPSNNIGWIEDGADITCPVSSYSPNNYGLYNVCGNVAEMVKEKGTACGGSWKSTGGDVTLKSRMHYTKSAVDLGFRYFMQIIEK